MTYVGLPKTHKSSVKTDATADEPAPKPESAIEANSNPAESVEAEVVEAESCVEPANERRSEAAAREEHAVVRHEAEVVEAVEPCAHVDGGERRHELVANEHLGHADVVVHDNHVAAEEESVGVGREREAGDDGQQGSKEDSFHFDSP